MSSCLSGARLGVIVLAAGSVGSTLAQSPAAPSSAELRETVVTANRSEQLLTEALPHTTVIGRDVIERSQAVDLPSLLAREAGFQFTQSGGRGSASNLFLRGSAALQVLVLIDGVPLTKQDSTGTVSLEHLMLDQVERVEIVRGNVSAIHGSGAIGGVIQVFTRKGQGPAKAQLRAEAGSYGSARLSATLSGEADGTRYSLGVGRHTWQGFSAMNTDQHPGENPDRDGYRNTNLHLGLSRDLAPGHTIGLRGQGVDGRFGFDGGGFGGPTDVHQGRATLGTWSVYSHNQVTRDWRSELTWSQGRERSVYDATLTAYPYDSWAVSRTRTLNWTNAVAFGGWLLTAGAEHQRQAIDTADSDGSMLARERSVNAAFAGLSTTVGAHSVQLNLRRDEAEGLAGRSTAYAGYGWQFDPAWKLIASTSSAFNLPPLGYLYDPFSGNPALRPETARSAELGLQWAQGGQVMRATLFRTRIQDLLQYDFTTFSFNNVSQASNEGLELSYTGTVGRAQVHASLTLQDPVDRATGQGLARRARTMASLGGSIPVDAWTLGAELRYTGARPDSGGRPDLGAYALVNLTARYRVAPGLDLTARVENLFDRDYQTAWGYNQPGRSVFVGMLWTPR
jgi:vitamin B12 transporter